MPQYIYSAVDRSGKRVKESVEASSLEAAKNSLRSAGYTILEINEAGTMNKDIDIPFLGNPKSKDMAIFCRQFISILKAGVTVSTVLSMLGQQTTNKKLAEAIRRMQADIEKGDTLANAMRRHPRIFPSILSNMVAAGEESGNLEASFKQMEVYFEKAKKTKAAAVRVMIYPCILLAVMVIVLIVMMTKIIPNFLKTFDEMGVDLPALTKGVMAVSNWFVGWWWLVVVLIVGLIIGGIAFSGTDRGKHFFGWLARKIPVVKSLTVRSACATFCRVMSMLLASGLTLTESLDLVAASMTNVYFKEAVMKIRTFVSEGWSLRSSLTETRLFPSMVCNMTGIGEETGDLEDMLSKVADFYDDEVQNAQQRLTALMEPTVILFMAVFVVIIVLSIFLPMLNMTKAYDKYLPS